MKNYDLICIGGGSGGIAAARRAAHYGAKVLVIEASRIGGTCVNVGCVPKKILWHAAQIIDFARLAKDYGFKALRPQLDYRDFADKREAFIKKLNGIYESELDRAGIDIVRGYASFTDRQTISIKDKHFSAKHIIIAVGGTPVIPDIPGAEHGIDSNDFFTWRQLPRSIAIAGAGYIAIELATALHTLGVETHLLIRKNRFLKHIDDDIYRVLFEHMQASGIHISFDTQISTVNKTDTDLSLALSTGVDLSVEQLLWAIGRQPLTADIGLQHTDVKTKPNGDIIIDGQQNTSQPGIYALGDITGQPTLTPAAIESGRQLIERLFNQQAQAKADFTYVPTVIFSHPAIASVGLTEVEAIEQHGNHQVKTYQSTFNPLLRTMSEHKVPTRMKMVCVGDEEKIIGLHLIGDFVDEIMQGFSVAVQMGACKADFDKTLAIHPTSGEELVTMR